MFHPTGLHVRLLIFAVCLFLAVGMVWTQTKKVSVESLIYDLKNPDQDRRKEAAVLLGQNRVRSAVPALIEATNDSDPEVRHEVTKALVRIKDRRAVPAFAALTRGNSIEISKEAVRGIEQAYVTRQAGFVHGVKRVADVVNPFSNDFDPVVVEPYENVSPEAIEALSDLLDSPDSGLRSMAAASLGTLRGRAALPRILDKLETESNDDVVVELIQAVSKIGDSSVGPSLIPLTRASSRKVRDEAIFALGHLRVGEAVPVLTDLYSAGIEERKRVFGVVPVSGSDEFQKHVFQSLSQIGAPASKELFLSGLSSDGDFYRRYGAEGLARVGDPGVLTELGRAYIWEKDGQAKMAISFALYRLGREEHLDELVANANSGQVKHYFLEFDSPEISKLYPYLSTSKPGIQAALLDVIGMRGDRSAMDHAASLTNSAEASVASAANLAIRRLQGRHG